MISIKKKTIDVAVIRTKVCFNFKLTLLFFRNWFKYIKCWSAEVDNENLEDLDPDTSPAVNLQKKQPIKMDKSKNKPITTVKHQNDDRNFFQGSNNYNFVKTK